MSKVSYRRSLRKIRKASQDRVNDTDNHIGGANGENPEKAGRRAGSVQSIENRQFLQKEKSVNLSMKVFS